MSDLIVTNFFHYDLETKRVFICHILNGFSMIMAKFSATPIYGTTKFEIYSHYKQSEVIFCAPLCNNLIPFIFNFNFGL